MARRIKQVDEDRLETGNRRIHVIGGEPAVLKRCYLAIRRDVPGAAVTCWLKKA